MTVPNFHLPISFFTLVSKVPLGPCDIDDFLLRPDIPNAPVHRGQGNPASASQAQESARRMFRSRHDSAESEPESSRMTRDRGRRSFDPLATLNDDNREREKVILSASSRPRRRGSRLLDSFYASLFIFFLFSFRYILRSV